MTNKHTSGSCAASCIETAVMGEGTHGRVGSQVASQCLDTVGAGSIPASPASFIDNKTYKEIESAILHELCGFRLQHQVEADDPDHGLQLIDALSCGDDVSTGMDELVRLSENITSVIADFLEGVEAND